MRSRWYRGNWDLLLIHQVVPVKYLHFSQDSSHISSQIRHFQKRHIILNLRGTIILIKIFLDLQVSNTFFNHIPNLLIFLIINS